MAAKASAQAYNWSPAIDQVRARARLLTKYRRNAGFILRNDHVFYLVNRAWSSAAIARSDDEPNRARSRRSGPFRADLSLILEGLHRVDGGSGTVRQHLNVQFVEREFRGVGRSYAAG